MFIIICDVCVSNDNAPNVRALRNLIPKPTTKGWGGEVDTIKTETLDF
jgi:hypothetical protein